MRIRALAAVAALPLFLLACQEEDPPGGGDGPDGPATVQPILVARTGQELAIRSNGAWAPTTLPEGHGRVLLGPPGGPAWALATIGESGAFHRLTLDGTVWIDEGVALEGVGRPESLDGGRERVVLRGWDLEGATSAWDSTDEGRTWAPTPLDRTGGATPRAEGVDELRRTAVATAQAMPEGQHVNDADVWVDPGDGQVAIAYAFMNYGPAMPGRRRCLATEDGGRTWREIAGPEGAAEVAVRALAGSGADALRVVIAYGGQDAWLSTDGGATWSKEKAPDDLRIYGLAPWPADLPMRRP